MLFLFQATLRLWKIILVWLINSSEISITLFMINYNSIQFTFMIVKFRLCWILNLWWYYKVLYVLTNHFLLVVFVIIFIIYINLFINNNLLLYSCIFVDSFSSLVFSNVDFRCLHQIEFFIGRFLHQIEYSIFKHVFHHRLELWVNKHSLSEDIIIIITSQLFKVIHVALLIHEC